MDTSRHVTDADFLFAVHLKGLLARTAHRDLSLAAATLKTEDGDDGATLLHVAAARGRRVVAWTLLEAGAAPEATHPSLAGATPLLTVLLASLAAERARGGGEEGRARGRFGAPTAAAAARATETARALLRFAALPLLPGSPHGPGSGGAGGGAAGEDDAALRKLVAASVLGARLTAQLTQQASGEK